MSEPILLTESEYYKILHELALKQGISIAELINQSVDGYLQTRQKETDPPDKEDR